MTYLSPKRKLALPAAVLALLALLSLACAGSATPEVSSTPTPAPAGSPSPEATEQPEAEATEEATPEATPGASPSGPLQQNTELSLTVTSPQDGAVVSSESVAVEGRTSPDATVSVNGRLVVPDSEGRFSTTVTVSPENNPMPIEVVASSANGEIRQSVRTVIFVR